MGYHNGDGRHPGGSLKNPPPKYAGAFETRNRTTIHAVQDPGREDEASEGDADGSELDDGEDYGHLNGLRRGYQLPSGTCKPREIVLAKPQQTANTFIAFTSSSPEASDPENDSRPTNLTLGNVLSQCKQRLSMDGARKQACKLKKLQDEQPMNDAIEANNQILDGTTPSTSKHCCSPKTCGCHGPGHDAPPNAEWENQEAPSVEDLKPAVPDVLHQQRLARSAAWAARAQHLRESTSELMRLGVSKISLGTHA